MPEGPEIRRAADGLADVLIDAPLTRVWFGLATLQRHAKKLAASQVVAINTKGKALLTEFDCGLTVYSHNQLYGRWHVMPRGERLNTQRQLRWLIETETHAALLYSASDLAVLRTKRLDEHPFLAKAGLDILSDKPTQRELTTFIEQPRFARRSLGALLLDQSFVAGIGNYLRSEILFCARLAPQQKPGELSAAERRELARQILRVTQRAYKTGGITNDAARVRKLKAAGWSYGRLRHYVFSRAGQPCHICGTRIRKDVMAGRRLYLCSRCQDVA